MTRPWLLVGVCAAALAASWCVGILGRGFWTPDEPREADIAWRMSWQDHKAVPLLAGTSFCEKPPFTYWMSAAAIEGFGPTPWAARLPNLLYALVTALSVGFLARRLIDPVAGLIAAAAISTFLLSYQVAIWLATDAPLLAAVAAALLGLCQGFYATSPRQRLGGYLLMHTALTFAFMSKSAAGWMVPALTFAALILAERRFRELLRFELYAGLIVPAGVIGIWVLCVYLEPQGPEHLKVFFWNNLVGRFTHVQAAGELQYASGHRNTFGKYVLELPLYLWPWTLLVIAAARRAWRHRLASFDERRPLRFALASSLPALALLSVAATARNVYLAPALPGLALLVGWWGRESLRNRDRWDRWAIRGTAILLLAAVLVLALALVAVGRGAWEDMTHPAAFAALSSFGLGAALICLWRALLATRPPGHAYLALLVAYCALLVTPAYAIYGQVDRWQDLGQVGRAIARDASARPLILFAPDETTRAFVDLYARQSVEVIAGPIDAATMRELEARLTALDGALVVVQMPGRRLTALFRAIVARWAPHKLSDFEPRDASFIADAKLRVAHLYELPNGRRYALLENARAP